MPEDNTRPSKIRVCIVGAGIVGLAGALFFQRYGFNVEVLERDTCLRVSGAGIQLHPNAVRVLKDLGVFEKIRARSTLPRSIVLKSYQTGRVLHTQDLEAAADKYDAPFICVHRGHLREILYHEVVAHGILIRHGINIDVSSVDLEQGVLKLAGSSETFEADLFLGADGGKSAIRQALVGYPEMVPHGKLVHWMLVDNEQILQNPRLRYLVEEPNCIVWLGPECQAVTYGLDGVFNIAFTRPWSTKAEDVLVGWQPVDMDRFRAEIDSWDQDVRDLIGLSTKGFRFQLFEPKVNDEKTPWISPTGKFCLVGDAAHQVLPYLAQGSAIGLESVSMLARMMAKTKTDEQRRECMDIYQRVRKERTGHINRATLKNGRNWQMADGPLKEERDREFLEDTPSAGYPNLLADPFFQEWLWGFDAAAAAEKAWAAQQNGGGHEG